MKKFFLTTLIAIGGIANVQSQNVGINKDVPEATLDIKGNDASKVFRVSTIPSNKTTNDYIFFIGEKVNNGYNLRKLTITDLVPEIIKQIPSLKRIVVKNNSRQTFRNRQNTVVALNEEVVNTATDLYRFNTSENFIEILDDGIYDITAWVGFQQLHSYDGDIIVSLSKADRGSNAFNNFKRTIISRADTTANYDQGNGVGVSFSFTESFSRGEKVRLQVTPITPDNINTLAGSTNLTISRTK